MTRPDRQLARPPARGRSEVPVPRDLGRTRRPDDEALYSCGCGHAFRAAVTTSVKCPRCGTAQPW